MTGTPSGAPCHSSRWRLVLLLVTFTILVGSAWFALSQADVPALVASVQRWHEESPTQVALATLCGYALWCLFLPTTVPELAAGYLFGYWQGWALVFGGKMLCAGVAYVLGRGPLRRCLAELFLSSGAQELLAAFEDEVAARPFTTAFLIRVAYVPMPVKNYGMALLGVPPAAFFGALVPVEAVDTYVPIAVGAGAKDLHDLFEPHPPDASDHGGGSADGGASARDVWTKLGLIGLELLLLLALMAHLGRMATRAIERRKRCAAGESSFSSSAGREPPGSPAARPHDAEREARSGANNTLHTLL